MKRLSALAALLSLVACKDPAPTPKQPTQALAAPTAALAPSPDLTLAAVMIPNVPHVRQKPDFCGEAVAAGFLQKLGKPYDQDQVFGLSGMDPAKGMGATTREMQTALSRAGFEIGPTWHTARPAHARQDLEKLFGEMHSDLLEGVPSIVCMHYDDSPNTTEHFRLILGYDPATDEIIYHEPAVDNGAYQRMKRRTFLSLWPLKYAPDKWTVIRMRLAAGELVDPPARGPSYSAADYAQHVIELKKRLPEGFSIVVEPPFVVIGDDPPDILRQRATSTVAWSVKMLKASYFERDPREILDVWLFKSAKSYNYYNRKLFGGPPSTPYGYYSPSDKALVMNIATGGGTLVHEIVHPFMEANFPDCPSWFNEGMGSLYEQSASEDGRIVGLTNWRLEGLQKAIQRGPISTFRQLTATSDREFYDSDPGTNYAQARYLMYYLQEQGLLRRYYREFVANQEADPTGYETLKRVLGEQDMLGFQRRWERYVLGLSFP